MLMQVSKELRYRSSFVKVKLRVDEIMHLAFGLKMVSSRIL